MQLDRETSKQCGAYWDIERLKEERGEVEG